MHLINAWNMEYIKLVKGLVLKVSGKLSHT